MLKTKKSMKKLLFVGFALFAFFTSGYSQEKYSTLYYQKASLFEMLTVNHDDIVFLGNSITDGCEWSELFNNNHIKNRGISGDIVQGVYERLDPIINGHPQKIFLMIGVNDISHDLQADTIVRAIVKVMDKIGSVSPKTKLYIQSLLPVNEDFGKYLGATKRGDIVTAINKELEKVCKDKGLTYIDVYSHFIASDSQKLDPKYTNDGLHLLGDAYLIWKSVLEKYINEK